MNDVYLAHYGVKGMKWGVRKARPNSNDASKKKRNEALKKSIDKGASEIGKATGEFFKQKAAPKPKVDKRDLSKYSDQELQRAVNRKNLERQYRQLTSSVSARNATNELLANIGGTILSTVVTVGVKVLVESLLDD